MKWILVIVVVSLAEDVTYRSVPFDSKEACAAAGEAFVESFPGFAWHDPADETAVEPPVVRSHLRCLPADEDDAS